MEEPDLDLGEFETYEDLLEQEVKNVCRCAECCRRLIIEVCLEDAEREPKIKALGSPLRGMPDANGNEEIAGYLLNNMNVEDGFACVFLDQKTNLCTIYETRPLVCRLFDCSGEGREQLIELGILPQERS